MTTTYTIAPAPRFAAMRAWDCARCGRAEVRPVFLAGPTGTLAYGTGCAARLLGWARPAVVRHEYDLVQAEADRTAALLADRQARYTAASEAFAAGDHDNPALNGPRRTYHSMGGSELLGSFPAWMAHVAATGNLEITLP